MNREQPPLGSTVYDEEGLPMRVIRVKDEVVTLQYEAIANRQYYRTMGLDDLYQYLLSEPFPLDTYDVVIEITARKVVRVSGSELDALRLDMVDGTAAPPIPLPGGYKVYSIRPIGIVGVS